MMIRLKRRSQIYVCDAYYTMVCHCFMWISFNLCGTQIQSFLTSRKYFKWFSIVMYYTFNNSDFSKPFLTCAFFLVINIIKFTYLFIRCTGILVFTKTKKKLWWKCSFFALYGEIDASKQNRRQFVLTSAKNNCHQIFKGKKENIILTKVIQNHHNNLSIKKEITVCNMFLKPNLFCYLSFVLLQSCNLFI